MIKLVKIFLQKFYETFYGFEFEFITNIECSSQSYNNCY